MKLLTNTFFLFLAMNILGEPLGDLRDPKLNWEHEILKDTDLSTKEYKDSITRYDFSSLWTNHDNSLVYGIIGDNYQRIRIKIISAVKDKNDSGTYFITGKSMVKNNICNFTGTIEITRARIYKHMHWGSDDEYKHKGIKKQGIIIAQYHFSEDSTQANTGTFEGVLSTSWYIDKKDNLKYDDIQYYSDGFSNNQFVGTWKGYKNNLKKVCNWGDYRVPQSGDFDDGSGGMVPTDKYIKYGWQSYMDALKKGTEQGWKEENKPWWK